MCNEDFKEPNVVRTVSEVRFLGRICWYALSCGHVAPLEHSFQLHQTASSCCSCCFVFQSTHASASTTQQKFATKLLVDEPRSVSHLIPWLPAASRSSASLLKPHLNIPGPLAQRHWAMTLMPAAVQVHPKWRFPQMGVHQAIQNWSVLVLKPMKKGGSPILGSHQIWSNMYMPNISHRLNHELQTSILSPWQMPRRLRSCHAGRHKEMSRWRSGGDLGQVLAGFGWMLMEFWWMFIPFYSPTYV